MTGVGRYDDDGLEGGLPAPPCRDCGAAVVTGQRYCLRCGARVDDRRLEPLAMLHGAHAAPAAPAAASEEPGPLPLRPVSLAAVTAVVVAGLSGALIGGREDAVAVPAPSGIATAPATTAAAPPSDDAGGSGDGASASDDAGSTDEAAATADVASEDAGDEVAADDGGEATDDASGAGDEGDDETTPDEAPAPPSVWVLALEGPDAAAAVDRIAAQGVRLTGVTRGAASASENAVQLLGGTAPAAGAPAPTAAEDHSLPAALAAAEPARTWRAYVDAQPDGQPPLAGTCAPAAAGDPVGATVARRVPFWRLAAVAGGATCGSSIAGLDRLGNDVTSGEELPALSYVALGGCPAPERTAVALPDQTEDAVATITGSSEFQASGLLVVTAVGGDAPCAPPAATAPLGPLPAPVDAPTVVLRGAAPASGTATATGGLRPLARLIADHLQLTDVAADATAPTLPAGDAE